HDLARASPSRDGGNHSIADKLPHLVNSARVYLYSTSRFGHLTESVRLSRSSRERIAFGAPLSSRWLAQTLDLNHVLREIDFARLRRLRAQHCCTQQTHHYECTELQLLAIHHLHPPDRVQFKVRNPTPR